VSLKLVMQVLALLVAWLNILQLALMQRLVNKQNWNFFYFALGRRMHCRQENVRCKSRVGAV
jgi:hypothetical protein